MAKTTLGQSSVPKAKAVHEPGHRGSAPWTETGTPSRSHIQVIAPHTRSMFWTSASGSSSQRVA